MDSPPEKPFDQETLIELSVLIGQWTDSEKEAVRTLAEADQGMAASDLASEYQFTRSTAQRNLESLHDGLLVETDSGFEMNSTAKQTLSAYFEYVDELDDLAESTDH